MELAGGARIVSTPEGGAFLGRIDVDLNRAADGAISVAAIVAFVVVATTYVRNAELRRLA